MLPSPGTIVLEKNLVENVANVAKDTTSPMQS